MNVNLSRLNLRLGVGEWIGILGILLAIVTWWHGTKSRDLSMRISPTVIEVVKSGVVSDLSVVHRGVPITSELRAYQIAIWNTGREPIRREDILKPILLGWSNSGNVVDIRLVKATREETEFSIGAIDRANRAIRLDWKIIENGDGALIQFLVQGDVRPSFVLSGTIVGQGRLDESQLAPVGKKSESRSSFDKWFGGGVVLFLMWFFLIPMYTSAKSLYQSLRERPVRWLAIVKSLFAILFWLLVFAMCIFAVVMIFRPESPFQF